MTDYKTIDTRMHGREGITGAFLLRGEKTALIETGPKSSLEHVLSGLQEAGVETLDWIVVTHIHLDHAGAAGSLAARFPDATVAVHHVGARHLVDPTKLWSSASRIYGSDMDRLWGGIDPIDPDRIHELYDDDKIDLGGRTLRVVETLGHAGHHHSYLDDETGVVFTGDAMGVRLQDVAVARPATPPPEFDLELAIASIERIRDLRPSSLVLTHFGGLHESSKPVDVDEAADAAIDALRTWESWIRSARAETNDLDEVTERVRAEARKVLEGKVGERDLDRMEQTTSYWMNTWGYMRYLDKREAAAT
jgi:glyoxylase-like metal-dependent hydrolase (beta-lactamase superfamily II)